MKYRIVIKPDIDFVEKKCAVINFNTLMPPIFRISRVCCRGHRQAFCPIGKRIFN
jgi:hypothetical protein